MPPGPKQEQDVNREPLRKPEDTELDILLDAPQLEAESLVVEIEDLELGDLVKIGKVRIEARNLDAQLLLQARLDTLLELVDRLLTTIDASLALFTAPMYSFNLLMGATYKNLGILQDLTRATVRVTGTLPATLAVEPDPETDGNPGSGYIRTVLSERGEVIEERFIGGPSVTEAAARRAGELGVDLSTVGGTGSGGRVLLSDVEKAARVGG